MTNRQQKDKELREARELARLALSPPDFGTSYTISSRRPRGYRKLQLRLAAAARSGWPATAAALLETRAALRAVHQRAVRVHYRGSQAGAPYFWSCGICSWMWEEGKPEVHEPSCPLANLSALLGEETEKVKEA